MALAVLAVMLLAVAVGLQLRHDDSAADQPQAAPAANASQALVARSDGQAFRVTFPDGWTDVQRVKGQDVFIIPGERQPEARPGRRAMVTDITQAGAGPAVLSIAVGSSFPEPQGTATDFVFGKGRDLLAGKKFIDDTQGAALADGQPSGRVRTYTYVFPLGGKDGARELRINYTVFTSDPRDNITVIESVVRSIRLQH